MFGENSCLSPLALRQQLLLAESELNRAQMAEDLVALKAEVRALANRAKSIASVASSAVVLAAGLAALQRSQSAAKPTWWQTFLQGARLLSTVRLAFRPPRREPTDR